jgi:hypothetical protein
MASTNSARCPAQRAKGTPGGQEPALPAHMPASTKTALGKQGAAVAQRKRTGAATPNSRTELYELAKTRNLSGRS